MIPVKNSYSYFISYPALQACSYTFIDDWEDKNSIFLKNQEDLQRFYTEYPGDIKFFVHDMQAPGESAFN